MKYMVILHTLQISDQNQMKDDKIYMSESLKGRIDPAEVFPDDEEDERGTISLSCYIDLKPSNAKIKCRVLSYETTESSIKIGLTVSENILFKIFSCDKIKINYFRFKNKKYAPQIINNKLFSLEKYYIFDNDKMSKCTLVCDR